MESSLTVVKVGGGLAGLPGMLSRVGAALARRAAAGPLVAIPGGGPFAEAVRDFDRSHGLGASTAHWMAVLAMDQFGHALVEATPGGRLVEDRAGMLAAHRDGAVPVLAPARWLRAADELPHSWEVTSDSLAAYLAMLLGADTLILVKPVEGGAELADPWFPRAVPRGLRVEILAAARFAGTG